MAWPSFSHKTHQQEHRPDRLDSGKAYDLASAGASQAHFALNMPCSLHPELHSRYYRFPRVGTPLSTSHDDDGKKDPRVMVGLPYLSHIRPVVLRVNVYPIISMLPRRENPRVSGKSVALFSFSFFFFLPNTCPHHSPEQHIPGWGNRSCR